MLRRRCGDRINARRLRGVVVASDERFDLCKPVIGRQQVVEGEDVVVRDRLAAVMLREFARQAPGRHRDAGGGEQVEQSLVGRLYHHRSALGTTEAVGALAGRLAAASVQRGPGQLNVTACRTAGTHERYE